MKQYTRQRWEELVAEIELKRNSQHKEKGGIFLKTNVIIIKYKD